MTRHVPISAFKDHASEYAAAANAGEEIVLTRHGRPYARLAPLQQTNDEAYEKRKAAVARLLELREKLRAEGRTATIEEMIEWKNEGRR